MSSTTAERPETVLNSAAQNLADAIESKEDFEKTLTFLAVALKHKVGLSHTDVYKVVQRLRDLETEIADAFVASDRTRLFASTREAQTAVDGFRANYLDQLLERLHAASAGQQA